MNKYFSLLRIQQWIKNFFILAPLFFSGNLFHEKYYMESISMFFCFSFLASVVYIINDYKDIAEDRMHPSKKNRALASGAVSKTMAISIAIVLFVISFGTAFYTNEKIVVCLIAYLLLNISYTFWLKYISILDVIIVALGFVLRVFMGGYVLNIEVSHWLITLTFLLALFIVIAKRRDDLYLEANNSQIKLRKSIAGYNESFITVCLSILLAILIVSYLLYVTSIETMARYPGKPLYISTLFVIIGVLRYLQITLVENKSGSPTKIIFTDLFTQVNIALWILFFGYIIYF